MFVLSGRSSGDTSQKVAELRMAKSEMTNLEKNDEQLKCERSTTYFFVIWPSFVIRHSPLPAVACEAGLRHCISHT